MKRLAITLVVLAGIAGSTGIAEAHCLKKLKNLYQPWAHTHQHYPPPPSKKFVHTKTHPLPGAKLVQCIKSKCQKHHGNDGSCPDCQ